jgi:hypothetical protein
MSIYSVSAVVCSTNGYDSMIFAFDLGGAAKTRIFSHVRVHRRPVHRPIAFDISKVHRLVHGLKTSQFIVVELVGL